MTRESSPPDTIRASGRSSSPGFGETKNSAWSIPRAPQARRAAARRSLNRISNARLRHRQISQQRFQFPAEALGRVASRTRKPAGLLEVNMSCLVELLPNLIGLFARRRQQSRSCCSDSHFVITSASVGPYFRFSRSIDASRSSTCCRRSGEASIRSP